jgi:hypothetical protein
MDTGLDIQPTVAPNKPPPLNSDQLNYLIWRSVKSSCVLAGSANMLTDCFALCRYLQESGRDYASCRSVVFTH